MPATLTETTARRRCGAHAGALAKLERPHANRPRTVRHGISVAQPRGPAMRFGAQSLERRKRVPGAAAAAGTHDAQPWMEAMIGIMRIATMFAILIIGLIAGPAVSL